MNYYVTWHESASVGLQSSVCGRVFCSFYFSLQCLLAALFTMPFLSYGYYLSQFRYSPPCNLVLKS